MLLANHTVTSNDQRNCDAFPRRECVDLAGLDRGIYLCHGHLSTIINIDWVDLERLACLLGVDPANLCCMRYRR